VEQPDIGAKRKRPDHLGVLPGARPYHIDVLYLEEAIARLRRERFLEVQVAKPAARPIPSKRGAIEIRLAEGHCVLVEAGFDPDHLRAVVAALEMRG